MICQKRTPRVMKGESPLKKNEKEKVTDDKPDMEKICFSSNAYLVRMDC